MRHGYWVLAALVVGGAARTASAAEEKPAPRFYYDMGADSIDVSSYPDVQQLNYKVFAKDCSQCHTLARPVNSPYKTLADWKRYITRMRKKAENSGKHPVTAEDAKVILDFLVYDSDIRKVKGKEAFEARSADLKKQFEDYRKKKAAEQVEKAEQPVKNPAPYTGDKPNP